MLGILARQEISKRKFNVMLAISGGAFVALALLAVAAYFGYKEYEKYKEKKY
jgi:predicted negative regulator of RcsB-dependent stress response